MNKYNNIVVSSVFTLFFWGIGYAQILNKPILEFTAACAKGGAFNEFYVKASYKQTRYRDTNNAFILELSDANGSFEDANKVKTLETVKGQTNYEFRIKFALPKGTFGDAYKIRLRSTHPAKISRASNAFAAYYLPSTSPILNNYEDLTLCGGNPSDIKVSFADGTDASVYTYNWYWYKNGQKTFLKEGGASFPVEEEGTYQASIKISSKVNCVVQSSSLVNVIKIDSNISVKINNGLTSAKACADEKYSLKASIKNTQYKYRWYKDKKLLPGIPEYAPEYTTSNKNQFATYHLELLDKTNGCVMKTQELTLQQTGKDFTVAIQGDSIQLVKPKETLELVSEVSKTGTYEYQWYKNDEPFSLDGKEETLMVSKPGIYYVEVIDTSVKCPVKVNSSKVEVKEKDTDGAIPNILTPFTADGINDTWVLPTIYSKKTNVKVVVYNAVGEEVLATTNYQNDWPKKENVKGGMLFYYRIIKDEKVVLSGTISVLE